jgi:hypothetical protein
MPQSKVHVALDSLTVACTADEIAAVFDGMLREMRAAVPFLGEDDRAALRRIMDDDSESLTVADVFPEFARGSEAHASLRRLRTAQFIRPGGRDRWDGDSAIEVKPFARLAWNRLGEAAIFGEEPEEEESHEVEAGGEEAAEANAAVEEEIDLSLPDVNDPDEVVTVRGKKAGAAAWEDDDVLDFLKDDKKDAG